MDIAKAAGVSQALLFYHFDTKDRLFAEAFAYAARQHLDVLAQIERSKRPPLARLRTFLKRCSPYAGQDGWRLWIDAWAESMRTPELEATSRRLDVHGRSVLQAIIEQGVSSGDFVCADPEAATWRIMALCDGLAIQVNVHAKVLSRRRVAELVRTAAANELGLDPAQL